MLIAIEGSTALASGHCRGPAIGLRGPQKVGCHPHFPALRAVGDCRRRR
ncbi:hypothetical protein I552_0280 [Mycobacterium xenopi 3993]|nr:hypothetical protein I552_0280 [Mycobacterium xenopi 3993]